MNRITAIGDMLHRYRQVFRAAWAERKALEPVCRTREELAFLPAHLELAETPLSPLPRWSLWIIMALFACALLWACLGKLDIVAVAPGKIVGHARTKTIQPLETAVVRRILVSDGQQVRKGDLLIELDAVGASQDVTKSQDALVDARVTALRAAALVRAMDTDKAPELPADTMLPAERMEAAHRLATSTFAAFEAKKQSLQAAVAQKRAELHTVEAAIQPLADFARIARERVDDYKSLLGKGYVSRQDYLTREQERINAERDLVAQRNHRTELLSAIAAAQEELAATVTDTRRQILEEERQAEEQTRQLAPEVAKASERGRMMQLRAPVDGTIQQLAIHTVGGIVTPAQALMAVVPAEDSLEAEVTVLNGDIGFVHEGQRVTVKIESFPYTRFGYLTGRVASVSRDAAQDDKLGLVFPARVRLDSASLDIGGTRVRVTPGMALSAEVKTGKRRVITYLLDPLKAARASALKER